MLIREGYVAPSMFAHLLLVKSDLNQQGNK